MTPFRVAMLALCVVGVGLPFRYFLPWLQANGWDLAAMLDAWHASDATSGLVWDLTVAAVTLTVWILWETARTRRWIGLLAIPATYLIGVSLGLPLYLLLRR